MKEEPNLKIKVNMILFSYHPTGSYSLYNPITEKMVVSRDVIIREAESWVWNQYGERTRVVPMQTLMQFNSDEVNLVLTETPVDVVKST